MENDSRHSTGIGSPAWEEIVRSGADAMGIGVSSSLMKKISRFAEILSDWNKRINLTAISDPEEVAVKHFLDSMAALPFIPEKGRLLDIGSGGGFPGLVLAIFRPSLQVTSIDGIRKKVSFQQHIIRTLCLKNAVALHARAEALAEANRSSAEYFYDVIVSRALGSLDLFIHLSLPLLARDGTMIAYKGVPDGNGRDDLEAWIPGKGSVSMDIRTYRLPKSGDLRSLLFFKEAKSV